MGMTSWRTRGAAVSLVLALATLVAACGAPPRQLSSTSKEFGTNASRITQVPLKDRKAAPTIEGTDLFGQPISLSRLRGQVVVINIWGSWCPPCRKEQPVLSQVSEAQKTNGVRFVGVAIREPASASRAFVTNRQVPYPSVSDGDGKILAGFSSSIPSVAVPTTYIIDRNGLVAASIVDRATVSTLTDLITDVVDEP